MMMEEVNLFPVLPDKFKRKVTTLLKNYSPSAFGRYIFEVICPVYDDKHKSFHLF